MNIFRLILLAPFLLAFGCSKAPSKVYKIGVDTTFYPLQFHNLDVPVFAFCNELMQEVAKQENIVIEKVFFTWDSLTEGLDDKKCDAILSPMRPYAFNLGKYDFSHLLLKTGPVLVVPYKSNVDEIIDLDGTKMGVERGSTGEDLLVRYPNISMAVFLGVPQMLQELDYGELSGALVPALVARRFIIDRYENQLKVVTQPLTEEGLRLVTLKGESEELRNHFDHAVASLEKSGAYDKLVKRWDL